MGGHLLHYWNLPEKRLNRADFDKVRELVVPKLSRVSQQAVSPLRFFEGKQDFGDLDIAVAWGEYHHNDILKTLHDLFGYLPHKNGNCYSFPVDGFQVDVLVFYPADFEFALHYYAFESGNFMGKVADKLGLRYKHNGLFLKVPLSRFDSELPNHEVRELKLNMSIPAVFGVLGFDYDRHLRGFKSFEEMSQWIFDSYYFDPALFEFDNLNSINRTRNRKRPVYAAFVEKCKSQPKNALMPSEDRVYNLLAERPEIANQVKAIKDELKLAKSRRNKFNGNLVREWRGIDGDKLGLFIKAFRSQFVNPDAFIDANSADDIKAVVKNFQFNL